MSGPITTEQAVFQILVGSLQTRPSARGPRGVLSRFQILVGSLQTRPQPTHLKRVRAFQILVGSLQTALVSNVVRPHSPVSNPCR